MREIKIGKNEEGKRLDKFLNQYFPEAGAGFLYKMLRKKNITLNKKKATGKEVLSAEDVISVFFSDETFYKFANEHVKKNLNNDGRSGNVSEVAKEKADSGVNSEYVSAYKKFGKLEVIFENDDILLINKPTGILSQKADGKDLSINEWLIGYLLDKGSVSEESLSTFRPSVCNRLDRNTSGIIICSKSLKGAREMARILKDRTLEKYYYAFVVGNVTCDADIDGFLVKDEKTNKVTLSKKEIKGSSAIKTSYHVVKAGDYSLLEVLLHTGKTHQIRVHLASIGHPIVGDTKYGFKKDNDSFRKKYGVKNQLLHARRIVFPGDMEIEGLSNKEFVAELDDVFDKVIKDH